MKAGRWLAQPKISGATVTAWPAIAGKLGLAPVGKLRAEHAKLKGQVAALRRERDDLGADIDAVRDAGMAKVPEVADAATTEVRRAAGSSRVSSRRRRNWVRRSLSPRRSGRLTRSCGRAWSRRPGSRLEQWSTANLANPDVPLPHEVRNHAKGIHEYPAAYGPARVPLRGLVSWLRAGLTAAAGEPMRVLRAAGTRERLHR